MCRSVAGDIVDSVDGEPVRDLATANRLLRQPHKDITVRVLRMAENKEARASAVRYSRDLVIGRGSARHWRDIFITGLGGNRKTLHSAIVWFALQKSGCLCLFVCLFCLFLVTFICIFFLLYAR